MKETLESLQWLFDKVDFQLNDKQKAFILHFINSKNNLLLQGLAGSGKSTVMQLLKHYYQDKIIFLATTGVANLALPNNIGGGTAHSALSLPTEPSNELHHKKVSSTTQALLGSSDLIEIIVIDEIFGFNSDNLDMIWRRIQRFNKGSRKRKKRNIRLLVVGDSGQQVTITDDDLENELASRWGHHLMFKSDVWKRFNFEYAVFDKVERQSDKVYTACLDVIRYGQKDRYTKCLEWINKRYNPNYDVDQLVLAATNKTVDKINQSAIERNPAEKVTFYGRKTGKFNMKDVLVKQDITLCVGALVMTVNNDREGRWVNGSRGIVTDIIPDEGVWVQFNNGETHFVEYFLYENTETYVERDVQQEDGTKKDELKKKVIGRLDTLPLLIAYAISISKSQGLSIRDNFVIDMEKSWLYTWKKMRNFGTQFLYVALSRGVDINLVTLATKLEPEHIKVCQDSIDFWYKCVKESVI